MHLILTGATGLVGSACLHQMLNTSSITKVSILTRRPIAWASEHAKANIIIHKDFTTYPPEVLAQLQGASGCVWALGPSVLDVSKSDYVTITRDYPLAAATAFSTLSPAFNFVYVSGEGATTTPSALTSYFGRIKGQAESALLALSKTTASLEIYNVRPAMVDSAEHNEIKTFVPRRTGWKKASEVVLGPAIRTLWSNGVSPTKELGQFLVDLAKGDGKPLEGAGVMGEGRTVANVGFRRLAGL